jgi:hypothetical protein
MLGGDEDYRRLVAYVAGETVTLNAAPIVVRGAAASSSAMRARTTRRGSLAAVVIGTAVVLTTSLGLAMPRSWSTSTSTDDDTCTVDGARAHGADRTR